VVQQQLRDDRQVLFLHVPVLLLLPNVHPQMLVVPLMLSLLIKASAKPLVVPPLLQSNVHPPLLVVRQRLLMFLLPLLVVPLL
jgi:hypothetical protein